MASSGPHWRKAKYKNMFTKDNEQSQDLSHGISNSQIRRVSKANETNTSEAIDDEEASEYLGNRNEKLPEKESSRYLNRKEEERYEKYVNNRKREQISSSSTVDDRDKRNEIPSRRIGRRDLSNVTMETSNNTKRSMTSRDHTSEEEESENDDDIEALIGSRQKQSTASTRSSMENLDGNQSESGSVKSSISDDENESVSKIENSNAESSNALNKDDKDETGYRRSKEAVDQEDSNSEENNDRRSSGDSDGESLQRDQDVATGDRRSNEETEYKPQSEQTETGSRRMMPMRALDALYRSHKFPNEPDSKEILDRFDVPTHIGYLYGMLVWGWFIAPLDGEYIFYTACDDACDLYMSPDEGKDHIRKIISQNRWSLHNQWDKYPEEQTSMGIRLAGGKAYYIQAVGAQSGGRDCLSVGVQFPTGVVLRPITRHFLTRAPVGPGGRFRMSPALARAQQADLQAAMGGNVGTMGPGGMTGVVPGVAGGLGGGLGDLGGPHGLDQASLTYAGNVAEQGGYLAAGGLGGLAGIGPYGTGGVGSAGGAAGTAGTVAGAYGGATDAGGALNGVGGASWGGGGGGAGAGGGGGGAGGGGGGAA
eukprot:TCONS_00047991-protein